MPPKFIDKRKRENWDREADRELKRREKRQEKKVAKETKKRERTEFLKWNKEIQVEEKRREILRDLNEEKRWHGSKKFAQIRRRFRRKFERRKPPAFNVVKTYSNANAKFTTYFDTYKIYVYCRVDPVAVFKKALDLTVEERYLKPGDKIRIIVSHPSWAHPFSTKLITITDEEQLFLYTIKICFRVCTVPLNEVHTYIHTYIKFYLKHASPNNKMLVSMGDVWTSYRYIDI